MNFKSINLFGITIGFIPHNESIIHFAEEKVDNLSSLINEAKNGSVHSMFKIATLYEYGGVLQSEYGLVEIIKDVPTAIKLYELAGKKGSALALYRLGDIYFHGVEVIQDQHLAIQFFISAAEKGEPNSMFFLGTIEYQSGDKEKAYNMLKLAADAGHPEAAYNTAVILYNVKHSCSTNIEQAMYYIDIALKQDMENPDFLTMKRKINSEL